LRRERLVGNQGEQTLAPLQRIGWNIKRQAGSHRTMSREGWPDYVFAFRACSPASPSGLGFDQAIF